MILGLPWRFWIWFVISFFLVEGTIEMNMPEGSKSKEILLTSFPSAIAAVVSLIFEGMYQFLKWSYKQVTKKYL